MPGDLIISDAPLRAAPKETLVPGSTRYIIKQVQALYTDNGAAGAWLPALEIVSDAGIVTGRYVGSSVAAGSDQEVTFHPLGSKGAASVTPVTTDLPWCRVRMISNAADQTITSGPTQTVKYNDSFNTDATIFTPSTGVLNQIKVLTDGLYSIRGRVYWANQPTSCTVAIQGVDTDAWAPYPASAMDLNDNLTGFVAMNARLQANQIIYLTVRQASGVNRTLYGQGGNFLELQRLGDSTVQDLKGGP